MKNIFFISVFILAGLLIGGCGGQYILTATDNVAAVGKKVTVVARLQRSDVWMLNLPVEDAMVRFRIEGMDEYAGTTDKLGYVGVSMPSPLASGKYKINIDNQDIEGDEVSRSCNAFIWEVNKPIVAVDMDSLEIFKIFGDLLNSGSKLQNMKPSEIPDREDERSLVSAVALRKVHVDANIIYLTRRDVTEHNSIRNAMESYGYPAGPILSWRRQNWHVVPGKYNIPKIVVESRLISQLDLLANTFPKLSWGICDSSLAQKAFESAKMKSIRIGDSQINWKSIAQNGFAAINTK